MGFRQSQTKQDFGMFFHSFSTVLYRYKPQRSDIEN
jgi:hypothetical protein